MLEQDIWTHTLCHVLEVGSINTSTIYEYTTTLCYTKHHKKLNIIINFGYLICDSQNI